MIRVSGIQTGIELNDQFSGVLTNIINSVNLAVYAMYDMQESMNADIDTGSIEGARDEINRATAAINAMNEALNNQTAPDIAPTVVDEGSQEPVPVSLDPVLPDPLIENPDPVPLPVQPNAPPAPVEVPVHWETDGLEVFTGTGVDRFRQEVQSANSMLERLSSTQDAIARQAYNTNLLPPEAFQNLNSLAVRIDMVRDRIQQISSNPVNIGTDTANAELEQLRSQLNQAVQEQNELNEAMQNMDVSAANNAYLRLSQTVSGTERYIRDNVDEQGRFNQEIQEGTQQAGELTDTIKNAVLAYVSIQSVGEGLNISDGLVQTTSRLNMMNDGVQSTQELVNMVYAAAQDARGSFAKMADVVARFGNNAGDAFGSSEEVVVFADLIQKQMTIAGASTQEASNAMLQLSQALGSGVLRGDELNSIFEQSPNLIRGIADYIEQNDALLNSMAQGLKMNVEDLSGNVMGHIRDIASEGMLSADIVKASVFSATDEINAKFESMPMTWGQIWQSMQNTALIAFQPVLQRLNEIANSQDFQTFVNGAIEVMAVLANILLNIFDLAATAGGFIADNWSIISPIIYGVVVAMGAYLAISAIVAAMNGIHAASETVKAAAQMMATGATFAETAAQYGLNAALAACPVTWIIVLIIALIAVLVSLCNWIAKVTGVSESGIGVIVGCLAVAVAFIINRIIGMINTIITVGINLWNLIVNFAAAFSVIFNDPVAAIKAVILSLFNFIVSVVSKAAQLLDTVFGSNLAGAISGFQARIQSEIDATIEGAGGTPANVLNPADYTIDKIDYGDAFDAGAAWGDGIADKVSNFSLLDLFGKTDIPNVDDYISDFDDVITNSGVGDGVKNIDANTGKITDSLDITEEDLKYLRDIAEQEAINRYTTAEIKVDMSGMQNTVNSGDDIDGLMTQLTDSVNEAVDNMTEGVHE